MSGNGPGALPFCFRAAGATLNALEKAPDTPKTRRQRDKSMTAARSESSTRVLPLLLAVLCLAFHGCAHAPYPRGTAQRADRTAGSAALAYTPGALWDHGDIAARLGVATGAIYVTNRPGRAGRARRGGRIVGDPKQYWAHDARLSPTGDLVAFHGRVTRLLAEHPGSGDGVGVLNTDGDLVLYIPRGGSFAWSPRGMQLAVLLTEPGPLSIGRMVMLWDRRDSSVRIYGAFPSRVGWAGEDSLLFQIGDRVDVVDRHSGESARTGHHGTIVSPDGLYSMRAGEANHDTQIVEDESGLDVTNRLFDPLRRQGLLQIRSAFWVRGRNADHFMCVSGSDNLYGGHPRCVTAIIDAGTGETIADFPGEALGPTGDGRMTVVLRHESNRLQTVNLERLVRRWSRGGAGEYY
jgi:hypothetical protein